MTVLASSLPQGQEEVQQRKLLYMGLYLLIWGEAANVRFMPECLCYIFHNVSASIFLTMIALLILLEINMKVYHVVMFMHISDGL